MLLSELFSRAGVQPDRMQGDAEISGMIMDSRKARAGSLFVAMPSKNSDSHSFIAAAQAGGATAVLAPSDEGFESAARSGLAAALVRDSSAGLQTRAFESPVAVPLEGASDNSSRTASDLEVRATNEYRFNEAVWRLAKVAFGNPSASMKMIGVTGTNGKTTTAWLIRDMLCALGVKAGYLGTLGFQIPGEERELSNTTPFSIELNELLAEARDKGVEAMAIEVSSHALAERRVDGIEFDAAVFTNLTQDHLDFHGSMEAYEAAKLRLFTELPKQSGKNFAWAANIQTAVGKLLVERLGYMSGFAYAAGLHRNTDEPTLGARLVVDPEEIGINGLTVGLHSVWGSPTIHVPLGGQYNVENCASAVAGMLALGYSLAETARAAPHVRPVQGRFEAVSNDAGIGILVDYAHTPDAVEKLLDAVRPLTKGRIITVFGCGGDRDRSKRPKMAKAASERSDVTVVTSDNPRTEDPQAILDEVLTGIVPGRESVAIIDRREAIAYAIQIAQPGDVVVIAGKGHENYQIIGRTKYPMDDRDLAREGLAARK